MEKGSEREREQLGADLHYMTGRYFQHNLPPCMYCKHLEKIGSLGPDFEGWTCKAYPGGISNLILSGELSHEHHQPNDHDYVYESKVYEDDLGKYTRPWNGGFEEVAE
jgi:hypothetical protein